MCNDTSPHWFCRCDKDLLIFCHEVGRLDVASLSLRTCSFVRDTLELIDRQSLPPPGDQLENVVDEEKSERREGFYRFLGEDGLAFGLDNYTRCMRLW